MQVKCHLNSNGCSRCTRHRKPCTFASPKQQSSLGIEKEKTPRLERQLGLIVQSLCPVSQRRQSPERPPSPSMDDGTGDSEPVHERELLPALPVESQSNLFDLSVFLDTFTQHRGDQDGPFPFFSPPETMLSPPASSGDEGPRGFSPQDGVVAGVENPSLHSRTLAVPPISQPNPCRCLAATALAVEEFETSCNHGNRGELDSIISHQKKAIACCHSMINCTSCSTKRENTILLIFITEKVVAACHQVVLLYNMGDGTLEAQADLGLSTEMTWLQDPGFQPGIWDLDTHGSSSAPESMRSSSTGTSPCWRKLRVGYYEVSSQLEWEQLMCVLISTQLRAVTDLLVNTRRLKSDILTEVQAASLVRCQNSIAKLKPDTSWYQQL